MDAEHFDGLIARLAMARLTRLGVLRGVAVGTIAGMAGSVLVPAETSARKKKKKKKQTICHCESSDPLSCQSLTLKKKAANQYLRSYPNDTTGPCPAIVTTTTTAAPPVPTCPGGQCTEASCGAGCVCVTISQGNKRCLAQGTCPTGVCTFDSCGSACTCINPGGPHSRCVAFGTCPVGNCSGDSCGDGCLCIGNGDASRCVSRQI